MLEANLSGTGCVNLALKLRDKRGSWLKYLVVKAITINKCIRHIGFRRAGWLLSWVPWRASVSVYCLLSYLAQKNSARPYQYWHDAKHTTQYFMLFTSFDTVYTTIHQSYMFCHLTRQQSSWTKMYKICFKLC